VLTYKNASNVNGFDIMTTDNQFNGDIDNKKHQLYLDFIENNPFLKESLERLKADKEKDKSKRKRKE